MKTQSITRLFSLAAVSTLLSLSACDSKDETDAKKDDPKAAEKAEDKAEKAADKVEAAVEDPKKADADADADSANTEKRFGVIELESKEDFIKRAETTLDTLDKELAAAKATGADSEATSDIQGKIAEARKDLDELENGTTKVIDDGKLGVTTAINSARRKLDRLNE